jgi:hypothetical protein
VESVRVHPMERSARVSWGSSAWDRVAGGNAAAFFFAWLIGFAVLAVSLVILWTSFNPGRPFELRFGFDNYIKALDQSLFAEVLPNTILVGLGTVATVFFFGFPLAWLLNRTNLPMRAFCISLIAVSVIVPGLVKAMGWIILLSPQVGLINQFLVNVFGLKSAPFDINSIGGIAFPGVDVDSDTVFSVVRSHALHGSDFRRSGFRLRRKHVDERALDYFGPFTSRRFGWSYLHFHDGRRHIRSARSVGRIR